MSDVSFQPIPPEVDLDEDEVLTCHWHPQTETNLRCYRCNTPICVKCAQRTPVGYLCPDCQRNRKRRFEKTRPHDYVVAGLTSLILGGVASLIPTLGSWWFVLFLSPLAGTLISEAAWRLVGRRYGQHLWWIIAGGITLGALPSLLVSLGYLPVAGVWGLGSILLRLLHIAMAAGSAITRLRLR